MLVNSWNKAQTMLPGHHPAKTGIEANAKKSQDKRRVGPQVSPGKLPETLMMQTAVMIGKKLALYKIIKFRNRDFFTRHNKLRLRYVAGLSAIACAGLITFFSAPVSSSAFIQFEIERDTAQLPAAPRIEVYPLAEAAPEKSKAEPEAQPEPEVQISGRLKPGPALTGFSRTIDEIIREGKDAVSYTKKPGPRNRDLKIGKGETVAGLLQEAGISGPEAYKVVKAMSKHYDPRRVKAGQHIRLGLEPAGEGAYTLSEMAIEIDPLKTVIVQPGTEEGDFESRIEEKDVMQRTRTGYAKIQTSLYGSAERAGIPISIINEVIRAYSWNVDFQRDIRHGDKIEVLYNSYETEDGYVARHGDVLYANLSVGGKDIPIYRFEKSNGDTDYYEQDGHSIRKTLMKTPIDGARLSSGFGMRRHPVLGYNKMHKGLDFAAPMGTPVYAAGDGTVEKAGRNGGYGNYIRIRHNAELKTAYAHLHKFKKGLSRGSRVRQGQVIGYVGTTGRSTGPHLHYEVLKRGTQVNPSRLDLPVGEKLKGQELARFKDLMNALQKQYVSLSGNLKLAQREEKTDKKLR